MALKVPDVGERIILDILRVTTRWTSLVVGLYQNNYTPVDASVIGDFTDATFNGYSFQAVTFGAAATVSGRAVITSTAAVVFSSTGGSPANTIYGYYVIDPTTAQVVFAERFGSSQAMVNNGDQISITMKFTGSSEF